MRVLIALFWLLVVAAAGAAALYLTGTHPLVDRFVAAFLSAQAWLPATARFEHFLIALTAVSLFLVALVVAGCAAVVSWFSIRHHARRAAVHAAQGESQRLQDRHLQQYDQLSSLGQVLSERLEKRTLVQHIIESASRMTSTPQVSSVVSLWLLHFETETFRFERGFYCDETMFAKTEVPPHEPPFSHVVSTQQPLASVTGEEGRALVRPEKRGLVGAATGELLIPLVIETSVLGVLVVFCHPEVVQDYGRRSSFYGAVWAELTLALAIAVQGEMAILDRLTGVHNREYFMKRFIQELERANRYRLPLSLLMIDIDNFKLVNDTLGHPQGDAVLKIVAKLIRKVVRAIDLVGRYGGEEFIVLLPETGYGDQGSGASGARAVGERIRAAVDEEFRGLAKPLNLTVSVGVTCRRFPEDQTMEYQDLIRVADEQLYRAKTTGKNTVCAFVPERPQAVS